MVTPRKKVVTWTGNSLRSQAALVSNCVAHVCLQAPHRVREAPSGGSFYGQEWIFLNKRNAMNTIHKNQQKVGKDLNS
ncbi:hypothetical protein ACRRTK_004552 [Alexandromys fortis]